MSRIKVLGLTWQPNSDTFKFVSEPSANLNITKRTVLSVIAQLYDPLGLLSPVIICAKTLLQELWLIKTDWDAPLPPELHDRWNKFRHQLSLLSKISIPRWLFLSASAVTIELHGFSDASNLTMAAAVYVRVVTRLGETQVNLVCAKTKVAPLKTLTIPRLELSAALILSKLMAKVQRTLNLPEIAIFLWTDSAVTLTWIASHPSKWKDFIRNRTIIIQETAPNAVWRFVPGKENPADCATRGVTVEQLEHHPLWWKGPHWLNQSPDCWPTGNPMLSSRINLEERPKRIMTTIKDPRQAPWDLLDRYSSLRRLLRITTLCRRAIARFRDRSSNSLNSPLTPSELQQSNQFWIRQLQHLHFSREIDILTKGELLPKSNPLIRLTPFVDERGILRVGGRLQHANLDPDFKHPFIIPKYSAFTTLIIADAHLQTLHCGTQVTLSYLRQSYWIIGGRTPVRSYILRCIRYRRHRAQQLMGQLPSTRITPSRPFLHAGVDYAGPISVKTWRGRAAKVYKGYIVIFTCFSTSATHLEIVTDYTAEAFLAAYKRFAGRWGICATLNSDCGTNFIGANAELKRLFHSASTEMKELATLLAHHGTEWRFIPPATPYFGGKWEAAVKSTKFHLRRTIGDSVLTYEEFSTLLIQIEAILNSRPLCPLSEDSDDYTALTPGHFLIDEPLTIVPEPNLLQESVSRLTRWQLIRQKVELFWKRWTAECLQRYQAISKWHYPSNDIKEGSLVLVMDERYPPSKWPLARIIKLHPGDDGLTRVVTLRTSISTFKRPITKICILSANPENETFDNSVLEGGRNV